MSKVNVLLGNGTDRHFKIVTYEDISEDEQKEIVLEFLNPSEAKRIEGEYNSIYIKEVDNDE